MTTPEQQHGTDPIEVAEFSDAALASGGITPSPQGDDASSELRFVALGRVPVEHRCPTCKDLDRDRKQAEADRDPSKVTDFNVLIVRHRMTHPAEP
ncbi:hypothetical protein EST92_20795 [Streptomyces sp. TM32]|uniref:hypothetical protein n=1 Tax=Streptomyces sp. TM32 TaxID=1652669 RepID=UPI0010114424|nr:hypothetical protein [Streptomyces sp. TM32]RXS77761.1 hypothetical protein EST92_20795 [Streptomyces sp. TM32]